MGGLAEDTADKMEELAEDTADKVARAAVRNDGRRGSQGQRHFGTEKENGTDARCSRA